ncbi:hypothetical protein DUI87_07361 [Hirundo rustica rustica]|uniref:Uncharacterized protein n=1 Tax=Hirundo rustica rustica TaxID=333673 RepID=A0A3M0KPK5_HIRRU|nr:hypothetical protein DUI87_07361 [Hirundo rustica rustica]
MRPRHLRVRFLYIHLKEEARAGNTLFAVKQRMSCEDLGVDISKEQVKTREIILVDQDIVSSLGTISLTDAAHLSGRDLHFVVCNNRRGEERRGEERRGEERRGEGGEERRGEERRGEERRGEERRGEERERRGEERRGEERRGEERRGEERRGEERRGEERRGEERRGEERRGEERGGEERRGICEQQKKPH